MDRPIWDEHPITVDIEGLPHEASLFSPPDARGIVLFAHGSGSSRQSPRNRYVAQVLADAGFAALLFDLLTTAEEVAERESGALRFDISLLADRLGAATDWIKDNRLTQPLPVGYFGASTGAAAALVAAAKRPNIVRAVVSRGGRPDLAGQALAQVRAPTLLIVGSNDGLVIDLNEEAFAQLGGEKRLDLVANATHLFEEPGALEEAARLATEWFERYLATAPVHLPFHEAPDAPGKRL